MRKITKIKVKYYSKRILKYLLLAGATTITCSSPRFVLKATNKILKFKSFPKRKAFNSFYYLKCNDLIEIKRSGHDVQISLTKEGKRMAGKYQINDLEIEKPKKWDKKWRVVIFDIPTCSRMIRDIFRRKLKEFGFYPLQKSVWVYPYKCEEEIKLLREFLGLERKDIQVITTERLDNDQYFKKIFKLK